LRSIKITCIFINS